MMGFLLFTDDEDLGALNLYSRRPGAFTECPGPRPPLPCTGAGGAGRAARLSRWTGLRQVADLGVGQGASDVGLRNHADH